MNADLQRVFLNFQRIVKNDFNNFISHHKEYFNEKNSKIMFSDDQIMITLEVKTQNNTSWNLVIIYEEMDGCFVCHTEEYHKDDEEVFTLKDLKENNFEKMRNFINDFFEYSYEHADLENV